MLNHQKQRGISLGTDKAGAQPSTGIQDIGDFDQVNRVSLTDQTPVCRHLFRLPAVFLFNIGNLHAVLLVAPVNGIQDGHQRFVKTGFRFFFIGFDKGAQFLPARITVQQIQVCIHGKMIVLGVIGLPGYLKQLFKSRFLIAGHGPGTSRIVPVAAFGGLVIANKSLCIFLGRGEISIGLIEFPGFLNQCVVFFTALGKKGRAEKE